MTGLFGMFPKDRTRNRKQIDNYIVPMLVKATDRIILSCSNKEKLI